LNEFNRDGVHLNIKIFILKIVTNNPKLFKPHASHWFEPICQYITSKKSGGGKGFHYFLRDLCTMLISWRYAPEKTPQTKLLLTNVVNSLILISADPVKLIFKQNIKIISTLMERWSSFIAINKLFVIRMLSMKDSDSESLLWKMNAVEVVALAVCYNIPVLKSPDDVQYLETAEQHRFTLASQGVGNGASVTIDPLMASILRIFESKKKQILYAASELVGMILQSQRESEHFGGMLQATKVAILSNEVRERHDVFVYSVERVCRGYQELLTDR